MHSLWKDQREKVCSAFSTLINICEFQVLQAAESISQSFSKEVTSIPSIGAPNVGAGQIALCADQLYESFDRQWGGFNRGRGPKFPTPHQMNFLLRYHLRDPSSSALEMVNRTLFMMRHGGIFDRVGCGLHRYATERLWRVPHFEKMAYDQVSDFSFSSPAPVMRTDSL